MIDKIFKMAAQLPLAVHMYGTPFEGKKEMYVRPFLFDTFGDGREKVYMEMLGDKAKACPDLVPGRWYHVQFRIVAREYTDANNQKRYFNRVVLDRIAEVNN